MGQNSEVMNMGYIYFSLISIYFHGAKIQHGNHKVSCQLSFFLVSTPNDLSILSLISNYIVFKIMSGL